MLWVGLEAEGDVTIGTVLFLRDKIPAKSIIFSITGEGVYTHKNKTRLCPTHDVTAPTPEFPPNFEFTPTLLRLRVPPIAWPVSRLRTSTMYIKGGGVNSGTVTYVANRRNLFLPPKKSLGYTSNFFNTRS